ncbi:SUMF1/EgtB/PvdO family nonheme iron enzyme [Desulfobacterales bacterium HSG2]|nr:SUMF1/EgtB/PvdO family nonheme iron enzyme [Desulfobacterales bacterium HSG2]
MKRRPLFFISVLTGILLVSSLSFSDRTIIRNQDGKSRLALVIGNADYKGEALLRNPVNDARDMTRALRSLGFEVIHRENAKIREMKDALREFGRRLSRGGGTGLFYFAGHGIQVRGRNYLIPIGAEIDTESDAEFESVDAGRAMGKMQDAGNALNIVILDACRNNPFTRGFKSRGPGSRGLAKMNAPTGSIIAYATAPGSLAKDGTGRNGVYTKHLIRHMRTPGLTIERVLKNTRIDVARETGRKQIPWEHSSLMGDFYFASSSFGRDEPQPVPSAKGSLDVECSVSGARVLVDGGYVGTTDLSGVAVTPGEHGILVEKEGYETYQRRISIEAGRSMSLFVELTPVKKKMRLYVDTYPADAGIRILNIQPRFHQGIELEPGEYHLEISADGYETERRWITAGAGDRNLSIRLNAVVAARPDESGFTNSIGMKFVHISPGTFMMGSPSDEPERDDDERLHRVTLTKGFYMQTTEVTQGQWKAVMGNNPSNFKNCGNNCPVEQVSWDDVQEFIEKLNRKEGAGKYSLPTEAEWEYACRAGTDTPFSFGRCLSTNQANYDGNYPLKGCSKGKYREKTVPVASFPANPWGLYDMHGNVWEWCQDTFGIYARDQTDPIYIVGSVRVFRGGSWVYDARDCRSANRYSYSPAYRLNYVGFRLARTP